MADTTRSISESLAACALTLGLEWDEYGQPNAEDFVVVLDSVLEHLEQFEGPVAMELPATNVKVDRDDAGGYNVYLRLGSIERVDDGVATY
jgi:hypothetical protein